MLLIDRGCCGELVSGDSDERVLQGGQGGRSLLSQGKSRGSKESGVC
jgi:hypothetical protein